MEWTDLRPHWPRIEREANRRESEKRRFLSTRQWNAQHTHLPGLAGEQVFALVAGVEVDWAARVQGDGGMDFPDLKLDVKTTLHWTDPWLRVSKQEKMVAQWYALVALDLHGRRGFVVGYCHKQDVLGAEVKDMGYGPSYVLPADRLRPFTGLPLTLDAFRLQPPQNRARSAPEARTERWTYEDLR